MYPSRRRFVQQAYALGLLYGSSRSSLAQSAMAGMTMPQQHSGSPALPPPKPMLHASTLAPFVDHLPLPEILRPILRDGKRSLAVTMREVHAQVHRDVPPTRMWSYGASALAPLIEARSGDPIEIQWINNLPTRHFLPIDHSLHGCGRDVPEVRAIAHVHGAKARSQDDGFPEDWFVPGHSRTCVYPLQQEATTLWYHDHAMGLNRLNVYAGLIGMLLVRDSFEDSLNLPSGKYEVPLTLYDRLFTADGQLFYPNSGDPEHPWVPEFAGDAILINGKIKPYLEVEPRLYRFRVLNAANSRFFQLSLTAQQPFHLIGIDQGLLSTPLELKYLNLAPAERADLLIDFSQSAGKYLHLINGGLEVLQFRVSQPAATSPARAVSLPSTLRPITPISESNAILTRTLTLDEVLDHIGNSMLMVIDKKHWHDPVTEQPRLNTTEIWEFVNLTEDTHPMHLHLVRFQVLDRRVFDVYSYRNNKGLRYLAPALPPESTEIGWKDVVQCPPGIVTRILVHFDGYPGKYLYHCHVLEHEANDMMRPFEVVT